MERLKVGVIFGGRSVEHDVSIVTAHQAMAALSERHDVVPIYVTRSGTWLAGDALNDLDVYKKRRWDEVGEPAYIPPVTGFGGLVVPGGRLRGHRTIPLDVVVVAIHGTFGEDGTVQGLLELAGIPYTGPGVAGSAVGMDKAAMKAVFKAAGLPVLDHVLVEAADLAADPGAAIAKIEERLTYPLFVKPSRLGSSVGIGKAHDRAGLTVALETAAAYDDRILVEPSAEGCIEVNCSVLGGHGFEPRPSVCEQPISAEEFLSFADKYMRSGKTGAGKGAGMASGVKGEGMAAADRRIPAPISDELTQKVQHNAVEAFRAVDAAGVARVDAFVNESSGECWVMEINTIPGSFSFYLWERSGIEFDGLMQSMIDVALAGHKRRSELVFTYDSGMLEGAVLGRQGKQRG